MNTIALAQTHPDGDRESWIRVTTGDHPVSDALRRHAQLVQQLGDDILSDAEKPAHERMSARRVAGTLRMLQASLVVLASHAEAVEDAAKRRP